MKQTFRQQFTERLSSFYKAPYGNNITNLINATKNIFQSEHFTNNGKYLIHILDANLVQIALPGKYGYKYIPIKENAIGVQFIDGWKDINRFKQTLSEKITYNSGSIKTNNYKEYSYDPVINEYAIQIQNGEYWVEEKVSDSNYINYVERCHMKTIYKSSALKANHCISSQDFKILLEFRKVYARKLYNIKEDIHDLLKLADGMDEAMDWANRIVDGPVESVA